MIRVKTKIGQSNIHGVGLFAAQFIPKGTVTWEYSPKFDSSFTEADLALMSESAKEQFLWYAYFDKELDKYVLCFDDQRFINHSEKNFNIISTPHQDIAGRNIEIGEELCCNYNLFDDTYWNLHNVDQSNLVSMPKDAKKLL